MISDKFCQFKHKTLKESKVTKMNQYKNWTIFVKHKKEKKSLQNFEFFQKVFKDIQNVTTLLFFFFFF